MTTPLTLDEMREEFAKFLASDPHARWRLDAALAHVVQIAYQRGLEDGRMDKEDSFMGSVSIRVELAPGTGIENACKDICDFSNRIGIRIYANFNDVTLMAAPGDDPTEIKKSFDKCQKKKFKFARDESK